MALQPIRLPDAEPAEYPPTTDDDFDMHGDAESSDGQVGEEVDKGLEGEGDDEAVVDDDEAGQDEDDEYDEDDGEDDEEGEEDGDEGDEDGDEEGDEDGEEDDTYATMKAHNDADRAVSPSRSCFYSLRHLIAC